MTWFLRHISIRLWFTALLSIPASIYIVLKLNNFLTGTNPALLFVFIALFFFLILGFFLDYIGKRMILNYIKEGTAWERAEIYKRSEEKYYKALRVYDSFLISPLSARHCAEKLSEAIGKFTAITNIDDEMFNKTATVFLNISPGDEHMALIWLKRLFSTKNLHLNTIDHYTLTLLAEHHYNNPKILPLLTNIFYKLKRTDSTAQKIYKKALILLKKKSKTRLLIQTLVREDTKKQAIPSELSFAKELFSNNYLLNSMKKTSLLFSNFLLMIKKSFQKLFYFLTKYEQTKTFIKFSFVLLAIFIMFNIMTTLFKKEIKKEEPIVTITNLPELPYTIQIAAFLSQPLAESYTNRLIKNGLDARSVKIEGENKTWFLVHISKFPDKTKADEYGQKLKREGLIKNFFVTNK